MSDQEDVLMFDPVAMNVVNRVDAGSVLKGELVYQGGLLVQGVIEGSLRVMGPLIVWHTGCVRGRIKVYGDVYLFGQLGKTDDPADVSNLRCQGTTFVAHTGQCHGALLTRRLQLYEGASLVGACRILNQRRHAPTLTEALSPDVPSFVL
jgi:cytoskeletal protein CcmA (bactofilin family)